MPAGPSRRRLAIVLLWAAPLAWIGCGGEGGTDIVLPSLTITTSTTGEELDVDGYRVGVDGNPDQPIGVAATIVVERLSDGPHTVTLSGLASNCVAGDNPRSVAVSAGSTATANFTIACTTTTGTIAASTATSGAGSDPDGFALTIDGVDRGAIGPNATVGLSGLSPGAHLVGLSGLAANCEVTGDNPISVTVILGQSTPAPFAVTCSVPAPNSGTIQVTTTTAGSNLDPDGYSLSVDGGADQPIGANATLAVPNIPPGQHAVQLLGIASNCTLAGINPRPVAVVGGSTVAVSLAITCVTPPVGVGSVQITAATTGTSIDDSYTLSVDGGSPQALPSNGSVTVGRLTPGTHSVRLDGVADNCTLSGTNPRSVSITTGQTATVTFGVACRTPPPDPGSLQLTTATTGTSPDLDGYRARIDGGTAQSIGSNATLSVSNLTPGTHAVQLTGVADNCTVSGDNPRSFAVEAGQTTAVSFAITCAAPAPSLNLVIRRAYITQSTQDSLGTVPLVAGQAAFLRVFVVADKATTVKPSVEVTFRIGSSTTTRTISAPADATPTSFQQGSLGSSWNLPIDGSLIQPGMSISATVDPENQIAETNESDNNYPASGTPQAFTVNTVSPAKIRFVPIRQGDGPLGNVTNSNKDQLVDLARRIYPLSAINTDLHAPIQVAEGTLQSDGGGWDQMLSDLDFMRMEEGSDRTYYGVVRLDYQAGLLGLGLRGTPTAMGTDDPGDVVRVAAHELGHTWNQLHTPCGGPPPLTIDPNYPYGEGIGVYGFDVTAQRLKPPSTADIMGYCINPWISDYTYKRVMSYRAANPAGVQAAASRKEPTLLVWGRIVNGQPILEPAFQVVTRPQLPDRPGPYSIQGVAADGTSLFSLSFMPAEVADDPRGNRHFAFAVPLHAAQAGRLADLRLTGPGGVASGASLGAAGLRNPATSDSIVARREGDGVTLEWNVSTHPMIMVRDSDTGEVLSLARGGRARVRTTKGSLELVASDGVRSRSRRVMVTR